ncbi:hypothetical protein [Rubritalea halochordaticola]|uniref:hypothetical protein n=1 Tax=Rubritalea halochordaticola TaxID=714537 RepID=UPI0031FDF5D0
MFSEEKSLDLVEAVSIVPQVLGGSDDPLSDGVEYLSFQGYGEMKGKDAQRFWESFKNKKNIDGFIGKGVDIDLIIQFKNSRFKKISLRMKKDSLVYIDYSDDTISLYKLSDESYELIKSKIIFFKQEPKKEPIDR